MTVKIKCYCGCRYELRRFPQFGETGANDIPICPNCRYPMDDQTLSGVKKLLEGTMMIQSKVSGKITIALKPTDQD